MPTMGQPQDVTDLPPQHFSGGTEEVIAPYYLFSHIFVKEKEDFEAYQKLTQLNDGRERKRPNKALCKQLQLSIFLKKFLRELRNLLNEKSNPGILILFYDKGYLECLNGIAGRKSLDVIRAENVEVRFAEDVRSCVQSLLDKDSVLRHRVRFVTAMDVYEIFGQIVSEQALHLTKWFIGIEDHGIRYDSPKLVEAIVRVRMVGSGIPVFRIDQDVLFHDSVGRDPGNANKRSLGLRNQMLQCVKAFRERRDDPRMSTFIFSGSYDSSALTVPRDCKEFETWSRAFATRVFPGLWADPVNLRKAMNGEITWDEYVDEAVVPRLVRKFYGIESERTEADDTLEIKPGAGIGQFGAHPLVSVISGALLCMSDGAILDLPPFSNFNLNVSWIDDHLKYSLHRELRHFTTVSVTSGPIELRDAKIDGIRVVKGRPEVANVAQYVLGSYLPTVLYGTIMDAWINPDPLIKWRPEKLDPEAHQKWREIPKKGESEGLLPRMLRTVLQRGSNLSPIEKRKFKQDLQSAALIRISAVRNAWLALVDEEKRPFAFIWADGSVDRFVTGMTQRATGLVHRDTSFSKDYELKISDLNEAIREDLNTLMEDTTTYIEMTLNWPQIVQQIRSFESGTVKTDLNWPQQ